MNFRSTRCGHASRVSVAERSFESADKVALGLVELHLPLHWSVEVDGLYRTLHFTTAGVEPNGTLNSVSPSPIVTWEFPVLVKYRFQFPKVKPFVEAGPSFRTAGNLNGTEPSHRGVTGGFGVEMHSHGLAIAPVLRYTHWAGMVCRLFRSPTRTKSNCWSQ